MNSTDLMRRKPSPPAVCTKSFSWLSSGNLMLPMDRKWLHVKPMTTLQPRRQAAASIRPKLISEEMESQHC